MMTVGDVLRHKQGGEDSPPKGRNIRTKEINKGDRVLLRNGWEADIIDGYKTRPTRLAKVYGDYTEMGSVYSTDIRLRYNPDGSVDTVVLTDSEQRFVAKRSAFGF